MRSIARILTAIVVLSPVPAAGQPSSPPAGRLVEARLHSRSLEGNLLGDPATRDVIVYLPPGYDRAPDLRYPTVYLLHGYGGRARTWLGENGYEGLNVPALLDRLIGSRTIAPLIVVMPDAHTRLGGAWYVDSVAAGRWAQFIAQDLVQFVDGKYRTIRHARGRGLAGHAMGGYGALRLAMYHPEVFRVVFAVSPSDLLTVNPFGAAGLVAALEASRLAPEDIAPPTRLLLAKAAAFAPDPDHPPHFGRLPIGAGPGGSDPVPNRAASRAWNASALVEHVARRANAMAVLNVRLEVGDYDAQRDSTRAFSWALDRYGVPNTFVVFRGGHFDGVRARFERELFRFFSKELLAPTGEPPDRQ